jgi:uncharacterized protein YjlB
MRGVSSRPLLQQNFSHAGGSSVSMDNAGVAGQAPTGMTTKAASAAPDRASIRVEAVELADAAGLMGSRYPARLYRSVFPSSTADMAAAFEVLFESNDWPPAWRAGLYTVPHYHGSAHEVLGVFRGWAEAQLGGERGPLVTLRAGDVLLIPAGLAHESRADSGDFCAVGAYPRGMRVDMRYERHRAADLSRLERLAPPGSDPVFGDRVAG